ncbi:MAG: DUF3570 domain-containing protein [Chlorobium sp.]|nr:MAG: DUF3570 domain-containing protein [Chlorobium sp.]
MTPVSMKNFAVFGAALLGAAMVAPSYRTAYADAAPERGIVSLKYLNYQDWQTGDKPLTAGMTQDRVSVEAFSLMGMVPIAGEWSLAVTLMKDTVTGASPAHHTADIMHLHDLRKSGDIQLTRYFSRGSLTGGLSYSQENDYISRGASLQGSWETEEKNTTWTLGSSFSDDSVEPNFPGFGQKEKKSVAGLIGVTRVLTKNDIVQVNLGYSHITGYTSDPYRYYDNRPDLRNIVTALCRWNHHFDAGEGTVRLSYRYYRDTWSIRAHTFDAEYVQPLLPGLSITPAVRLYTQTGADFYLPVNPADPSNPAIPPAGQIHYSEDQRLSAFGALTLGFKVSWEIGKEWTVDGKYDHYEQRGEWSLAGTRDTGLATFKAHYFQFGVSRLL